MNHANSHLLHGGFTLVEVVIGAAVGSIVSIGVFAVINTGSMLAARNLSVNLTSNAMRQSLDRVEQLVQQADSMPTLIDTAGNGTLGPAPGVLFDRFIGAPYVVNAPGGLAPGDTSIALVRSTVSASSPPIPQPGDIILINGKSTLRPRVISTTVSATDSSFHQTITANLSATLGGTVNASGTIVAKLVRRQALIVMPTASGNQLRYYPSIDTTSNLSNPAGYILLSDMVGVQSDDATPFTIQNRQTQDFLKMSLRVRASNFDKRLLGKQSDQFNTFARVDTYIRPKVNPQP